MKTYTFRAKSGEFAVRTDAAGNTTCLPVKTFYRRSDESRPTYADGARDADRLIIKDTGTILVFDQDSENWMGGA